MMSNGGASAFDARGLRKARLRVQSRLCGVLALSLIGGGALAQTTSTPETKAPETKAPEAKTGSKTATPAPKPADAKPAADDSTNADTLTVTGQKPLNRIDRQTYDNTKDPDSKTGTALDALAKVPGVSVDPSGAVTLRGKTPEIMINGRPAAELQGDNRAAALQGMSSGSITSIEVMNNPGAQTSTGSSSSVINLVTRAVMPPGGFVSAMIQSTGGYNLNGSGHTQFGKISLNGSVGLGSFKSDSLNSSGRRSLDANGQTLRSTQSNGQSAFDSKNTNARLTLTYALSKKDVLEAGLVYFRSDGSNESDGNNTIFNAAGVATDIYTTRNEGGFLSDNKTVSLSWNHTGKKTGETLKVDWRGSQGTRTGNFSNLSQYSLASVPGNLAGLQSRSSSPTDTTNSTFSVDYNLPIGDDQLTTGLQITSDSYDSRTLFSTTGAATSIRNSEYDYLQTVNAFYATYQKPLGNHWTVLGGLRVETFDLVGKAPLVNLRNYVAYTSYNPSLFATYIISDKAKVRLNYSHRLQRPQGNDYNPQTIQTSETNISVGQANLKPQETDSVEAGYEFSNKKGTSFQLRGYATRESGMVISVSNFVADPLNLGNLVLRTGRQNAGTRETVGTELNYSGKLTPKLSVNANGNLTSVTLDTPNFKEGQSVIGLTGRASLSYQLTTKDRLFLSYNITPKTLDTQGYRNGFSILGLLYSRKVGKTMQLTLSFNDIARSTKTKSFTTTPTYDGFSVSSRDSQTVFISLSKSFGGTAVPNTTIRTGSTATPPPGGAATPSGGTTTIIRY